MRFHVEQWRALALAAAWLACPAAAEWVRFPGPNVELAGWLERPQGDGPFPAIVLMHGCGGLTGRDGRPTRSFRSWAEHWRGQGFAALLVDSFGPRGERETCTQSRRRVSGVTDRPLDAEHALRWLAARGDVQAGQIHLMGWSNGGTATLHAASRPAGTGAPGFRSAVAFYPGCRSLLRADALAAIPTLVLAGGADDWTPAHECVDWVGRQQGSGRPVEIVVYEGAHHAFDRLEEGMRYRPEVRNPSSPTGRGATVGPDPAARDASKARATRFIRETMVPRGTSLGPEGQLP